MTTTRFEQRFLNLQKASAVFGRRLDAFLKMPQDEGDQMALVQAFEIVLELSWKTMKDHLENEGYADIASPRVVLRTAFSAGLITKGDDWMEGLRVRNLTSHIYLEEIMTEALNFIANTFSALLSDLMEIFRSKTQS